MPPRAALLLDLVHRRVGKVDAAHVGYGDVEPVRG